MHIKLIHSDDLPKSSADSLLRLALGSQPIASVLCDALSEIEVIGQSPILARPQGWPMNTCKSFIDYDEGSQARLPLAEENRQDCLVITNGRYAVSVDPALIERLLSTSNADVIAIDVAPELGAYRENFRFARENQIAGCRRLYSDIANYAEMPRQWPHITVVKNPVMLENLGNGIAVDFECFKSDCEKSGMQINALKVGGKVFDLETEKGLMSLLMAKLKTSDAPNPGENLNMKQDARIVGEVVLGDNVTIGKDVLIVGPAVIGDNVTVSDSAIINSCVISDGLTVPANSVVQYRLVKDKFFDWHVKKNTAADLARNPFDDFKFHVQRDDNLRGFRKFSYPVFLKRGLDIVFSSIMLILFAPVFLLVAIALNVNCPGPLFYRARRQGVEGEEFDCLKFRTMIVDAEDMQDNLRIVNQIDGPQFKMQDDPRISSVGRFLRETSIDEIPQFINVFRGEMSVVGPRPSPEKENTLCPSWRDVRLSVRPGITGLWQVSRTRLPGRDFQEWIHYDMNYVRKLSLKQDIWISWKTATQLISAFVKQF